MMLSLLSAGSKLLSSSKRKKSGKDMVGSIMNKEQKALPAVKPKRVTSSAIVPKRTVIPTTQLLEPPKESNSVDGIRTKIETLISMFGSKFSARKKIDKNKNQTDDLQRKKEKEDRIEATKSLRTNAFPKKKIPGEGALDGLKRFFTFTLIGFLVNNVQKIIEAIQGFIERLKPVFKVIGEFINKLKDAFIFVREAYDEHKPKIEQAIDFAKEKYEEFKEKFDKFKEQFDSFIGGVTGFAQKIIDFVTGKGGGDEGVPSKSQSQEYTVPDDQSFKESVSATANRLGISEDDLYTVMAMETAGTFNPAIQNPKSKATGLIQFTEPTAKGLGTTTAELAKMSRTEQMKYVEKFLSNKGISGKGLSDIYMAILFPVAVGKPDDFVLFGKGATVQGFGEGSLAYEQNKPLDINNDGSITKAEASAKVRQFKGVRPKPQLQSSVSPSQSEEIASYPSYSENQTTIITQRTIVLPE